MKMKNKTLYFGIILIVSILLLFTCSHFLQIIFGDTRRYWMGIETSSLIIDIVLYLAIGLMFVMLILWVRFYISRGGVLKRRKR